MPSGKLGAADLAAAVDTLLCTASAAKVTTANICLCNRGEAATTVRVAIGTGAAPAVTDYIEYEASLPANGILERTGVVLTAGEKVWVRAAAVSVSARAHGFEEAA